MHSSSKPWNHLYTYVHTHVNALSRHSFQLSLLPSFPSFPSLATSPTRVISRRVQVNFSSGPQLGLDRRCTVHSLFLLLLLLVLDSREFFGPSFDPWNIRMQPALPAPQILQRTSQLRGPGPACICLCLPSSNIVCCVAQDKTWRGSTPFWVQAVHLPIYPDRVDRLKSLASCSSLLKSDTAKP